MKIVGEGTEEGGTEGEIDGTQLVPRQKGEGTSKGLSAEADWARKRVIRSNGNKMSFFIGEKILLFILNQVLVFNARRNY